MACLDLDRIAPTRRPEGPAAGTQRWRELLFLHRSFDPSVVRPLVPAAFDLDLWDGRAWVGVVPFRMQAIRSSWMPRRAGLDFLETNVRTYVHYRGEPGVYFFSLEASSWLAVRVARLVWGLPYFHAAMEAGEGLYRSTRAGDVSATVDLSFACGGEGGATLAGTLEHFLLERYYLFCAKGERLFKGQVNHVPYPTRAVRLHDPDGASGLLAAAGLAGGRFETAHFSPGVDVEVFGPHEVAPRDV